MSIKPGKIADRAARLRQRASVRRLNLQCLENRRLLTSIATITINTLADTHAASALASPLDAGGNVSLRSAVEFLNAAHQAGETIAFDFAKSNGPIELTLGQIEIDESMTIQGLGVDRTTIRQSGSATPLFQIDTLDNNNDPVAVSISNLTLDAGTLGRNNAAAVENLGSLTVDGMNFNAAVNYGPQVGDAATLVSRGGQVNGIALVNGTVVSQGDDAALHDYGNVYPFQADYSEGLQLHYDVDPKITIGGAGTNGENHATITRSLPVPAGDIVADWHFQAGVAGQPAGTIVDSSRNGLDGTPVDGPVYSANVPLNTVPQTGQPDNSSLQFNGTNQRIFVPDSASLQLTHSMTIEAFVYVTAAPVGYQQYILIRGDDRAELDPYSLTINNFGSGPMTGFFVEDANYGWGGTFAPLPGLNQWVHIAGTLDDATGEIRLYVDGVEKASTVTAVRPLATLDPNYQPGLGIGNTQSGNYDEYFHGLINEVRLSDVALSPDQFLGATPGNVVVTDNGSALLSEPASQLNSLTLQSAHGGGLIDVAPDHTVPITVHGEAQASTSDSKNTLVLPQWGGLSQTLDPGSGYSGTWTNSGYQPVKFDGIRTLELKVEVLPSSSVASLPAVSPASFGVSWSGDDAGGPGIANYDVLVSDNGGPFTAWLTGTTATSATWRGTLGHTYSFYSVAYDAVGRPQPTPGAAQATTLTVIGDAHQKFVAAVYQDVLGRAPDVTGLAYWAALLDQGRPASSVAQSIAHSNEYYANFVIKPDFLKLFGRAAEDGAVTYWTQQMQQGLTDQQLEARLLASQEFYAKAESFDPTPDADDTTIADLDQNTDWIDAIYTLLLGRHPDSGGEQYWTGQLSAGVSRGEIALRIANSAENNAQLINDDYVRYLGRVADEAAVAFWLAGFAAGNTNEDLIAGITGADEYYRQHTK